MRASALSIFLLIAGSLLHGGDDELSGKWKGTWLDTRPESGNSGGPLWAEATLEKKDVWKFIFRIDSKRTYEVLFKAKRENGELRFSGYADARDKRGLYYWTAKVDAKGISGTYEGVEEKGTFSLTQEPPPGGAPEKNP